MKTKLVANSDILFIQHYLGPFIARLNAMIECGLDCHRAWFVDIPCSTHSDAIGKMVKIGFFEHHMNTPIDSPLNDYEAEKATLASAAGTRKNSKEFCGFLVSEFFNRIGR